MGTSTPQATSTQHSLQTPGRGRAALQRCMQAVGLQAAGSRVWRQRDRESREKSSCEWAACWLLAVDSLYCCTQLSPLQLCCYAPTPITHFGFHILRFTCITDSQSLPQIHCYKKCSARCGAVGIYCRMRIYGCQMHGKC